MEDSDYYARRAERQLGMAERATDPAVCRAHVALANLYLARVARAGHPDESELPRLRG